MNASAFDLNYPIVTLLNSQRGDIPFACFAFEEQVFFEFADFALIAVEHSEQDAAGLVAVIVAVIVAVGAGAVNSQAEALFLQRTLPLSRG